MSMYDKKILYFNEKHQLCDLLWFLVFEIILLKSDYIDYVFLGNVVY